MSVSPCYEVIYTPQDAGTYDLAIRLGADSVGMCVNDLGCANDDIMPFYNRTVEVYPGPSSEVTSVVILPSAGTAPAAGRKTAFTIEVG
jgi:hypothetical protein